MGGFDGHLEPAADVAKGQGVLSSVYYWSYVVIVVVLFLNIAVAILVDSYGELTIVMMSLQSSAFEQLANHIDALIAPFT